jgi:O-antigen/teichoic acid export membrane protein
MSNFFKNSLITFITEIGVFILGLLTLVVITRVLGPEGKGAYSLITLVPVLMISFGSLGIGGANVYFVGSKKYKIQDVVSNSFLLATLWGFLLILAFWALLQFDFFRSFIHFNESYGRYLWIVVFSIPISLLYSFFQNIIRGNGDIVNYNKIRLLEGFLAFFGVFVLLIILGRGVFGAVFSYVFSIFGTAVFTIFLVRKISKIRLYLNKALLKDSVVYGGKVYIANALSFLNYRLDIFLIAFLLQPSAAVAAVGFYSIAVAIAERMFIIPGTFSTVLFPKISSAENSDANNFTPRVVRHTFFIMIVLSLLLFFTARFLILFFFGLTFLPAVAPLLALLPGIIAFGVGGVLAADLGGRGKPEIAVYSSLVCLIINIVLNIIMIPYLGILGAAIASSISYWADTLVVLIAFLKISKNRLSEVIIIKKTDFKDYSKLIPYFKERLKFKDKTVNK